MKSNSIIFGLKAQKASQIVYAKLISGKNTVKFRKQAPELIFFKGPF